MKIPDKCLDCSHAIIKFEEVHDGWCKYHLDCVVRCDCFPVHYIVGCSSADQYCKKKPQVESEGMI